jgi:hypothetical protein
MSLFILLTTAEAEQTRGAPSSTPKAALNPVARQGEVFILPVSVLLDKDHEPLWERLSELPQMDSEDQNFPAPIEEED